MQTKLSANEMLDREFLQVRCRLIDMAASLDRIDRTVGAMEPDHINRLEQLKSAARLLTEDRSNRAERLQLLFSDPYDDNWRSS